jgi:hypothetical protein
LGVIATTVAIACSVAIWVFWLREGNTAAAWLIFYSPGLNRTIWARGKRDI